MNINNLRYAVLLADNQEDIQKLVDKANVSGLTYNVKVNTKKTRTIVTIRVIIESAHKITLRNGDVEQVKSICLEQDITEEETSES